MIRTLIDLWRFIKGVIPEGQYVYRGRFTDGTCAYVLASSKHDAEDQLVNVERCTKKEVHEAAMEALKLAYAESESGQAERPSQESNVVGKR